MNKIMKRFLLFFSIMSAHYHLGAMDRPQQFAMPRIPFTIDTKPSYNERDNQYYLCARVKGIEVARVWYSFIVDTYITRMHSLRVLSSFRKQGIASALLKACIAHAKKNQKKYVIWEAMPLEAGLTLELLIEIYKKMVHSIDPTVQLTIGAPYGPAECKKVNISMQIGEF